MDAERVAEALRRYVLDPSEQVERRWDEHGSVTLKTRRFFYEARPADWAVAREPWVRDALRVLADSGNSGYLPAFGLLFCEGDEVLYLNDVATMRQLGRSVGARLDPIAYAELLAELHYPPEQRDEQVVRPGCPGRLIRDPGAFLDDYPFVDPALLEAPEVGDGDGGCVITFQSYLRYISANAMGVMDIYGWTVTVPRDGATIWSLRDVARHLEEPLAGRG